MKDQSGSIGFWRIFRIFLRFLMIFRDFFSLLGFEIRVQGKRGIDQDLSGSSGSLRMEWPGESVGDGGGWQSQ